MTRLPTFELTDGRQVPVLAEHEGAQGRYTAFVLFVEDEVNGQYWVTWTDGINWWEEKHYYVHYAFTYLGALIHAVDNDEFLRTRDEVSLAAGVFLEAAIRQ